MKCHLCPSTQEIVGSVAEETLLTTSNSIIDDLIRFTLELTHRLTGNDF